MKTFGNIHAFKRFKSFKERENWWLGRLVKVKETLNTIYIKTPAINEIGIVIKIQETAIGCHLEVFFSTSESTSWIMDRDVYSQEDKK